MQSLPKGPRGFAAVLVFWSNYYLILLLFDFVSALGIEWMDCFCGCFGVSSGMDWGRSVSIPQVVHAEPQEQCAWKACLGPRAPGPAVYRIEVTQRSQTLLVLRDVLFGHLFLCVGQSNMALNMQKYAPAGARALRPCCGDYCCCGA